MTATTFCLIVSIIFLCVILYFTKKRGIEFKYGILWFAIGILLILCSLNKNRINSISEFCGIHYSPSFLSVLGILFCLGILFYVTLKLSITERKNTNMAQEIGIIKNKIDNINIDKDLKN